MNEEKVDYYEIEFNDINIEQLAGVTNWVRADWDAGFNCPDTYATLGEAADMVNAIIGESEGEYKSEEFRVIHVTGIAVTRTVVGEEES